MLNSQLKKICITLAACSLLTASCFADTFNLPEDGSTIVGTLRTAKTISGDTLTSIGRRYDMGIVELIEANPKFKVGETYGLGKEFIIPDQFILPDTPHQGIVVNLAELRLYFYVPNTKEVITFPVGIGRQGWDTPLGLTYIAAKIKDPTWVVPPDIKAERLKDGVTLPESVGPGPENPLGPYELRLGLPAYLIHGSNDPSGIGRRSSSGCIRMQPEAIESFYQLVPKNFPVMIVDQPAKVGWLGNDLYLEVHIPLDDDPDSDKKTLKDDVHNLVEAAIAKRAATVDWNAVDQAAADRHGYPIKIGEGTGPIPNAVVPINPSTVVKVPVNDVHARKTIDKKDRKKEKDKHKKNSSWF